MDASIPKAVVGVILEYLEYGYTFKEAEKNRLKLMKERKVFVDDMNQEYERTYSLCEH